MSTGRTEPGRPIRVLIAEDEDAVRDVLADLISLTPTTEVVAAVGHPEEIREAAQRHRPDVAILDVRMAGGGGPAAAQVLAEVSPATKVLGLSAYDEVATVMEMLKAGAVGYLVKGTDTDEVIDAVERAARGQASLSAGLFRLTLAAVDSELDRLGHAEAELRRNEERFRQLHEAAPDASVVVDGSGRILLVNQSTERMFGYARKELLGGEVEMLIPERFRRAHQHHRQRFLADPQIRPMGVGLELAGRRKDGTEFPVDISLSYIHEGEDTLLTARIRDITEIRRSEQVTRRSEERFRSLMESSPDALIIVDTEGRVELANAQAEQMFGWSRRELIGQPVEVLLPERLRGTHVRHRSGYIQDPKTRPMGVGLELAGRRKDGTEFPVDISLSPLEVEDRRLVVAAVRDVTERKRAEGALQRSLEILRRTDEDRRRMSHLVRAQEMERRRIAADVHDDSVQAMIAAGMRLQLLRGTLPDETSRDLLDDLEASVQRAVDRLRHLLFELGPRALDGEGLAAALRAYLAETFDEEEVEVRFENNLLREPSPELRVTIYRVAQEALTNVRKHADARRLDLEIGEQEGGYLVRVQDDGAGFEPSTQPDNLPGHLGLPAMLERAEATGGWLRIESAPGQGTTVTFWMPELAGPKEGDPSGSRSSHEQIPHPGGLSD